MLSAATITATAHNRPLVPLSNLERPRIQIDPCDSITAGQRGRDREHPRSGAEIDDLALEIAL